MQGDPVIDAEIVEDPADPDAAKRLDTRIRLLANTIADNLTKLYALVEQTKARQIHVALGFASWTAYVADVFTVEVRLNREQRQELVEVDGSNATRSFADLGNLLFVFVLFTTTVAPGRVRTDRGRTETYNCTSSRGRVH
jgi:hypothetical protein